MCPRLAYSGSPIRWKSMDALKALYPDSLELLGLSDETRVVVSEPLGNLQGAWNEAPESHVVHRAAGGRRAQVVPPAALSRFAHAALVCPREG